MANQINTRLMLKHDSLTNWNESSVVLMPGEVGVAYIDVATKDAKGNIIHVPTALLKVGENKAGSTKTFKELPFVSALAADVYAWAKEQSLYVETVGEGEAVANVEFKATEAHPNGAIVITKTDLVTPAELANALTSYYTKTQVDNLFKNYYNKGEIDNKFVGVHDELVQDYVSLANLDAEVVDRGFIKADALPTDLGDLTNNAGYAKTADLKTDLKDFTDSTNKYATVEWANSTFADQATTLEGYGITDAYTKTYIDDLAEDIRGEMSDLDVGAIESRVDSLEQTRNGHGDIVTHNVNEFATAAQGALAATAVQPGDLKTDLKDFTDSTNKYATREWCNSTFADQADTLAGYGITDAYTKTEADAAFATPTEVIEAVNKAIDDVANVDSITNITTLVEYANANAGTIGSLIAEVYGAETITDTSRIDTAVSDSSTAKANAAEALGTANSASSVASEAKQIAEEAKSAATTASGSAVESAQMASDSALRASEFAEDAEDAAGAAAGSASAAASAKQAAVDAQAAAETAKNAAETAAGNADDFADTASRASADATEMARQAAESASTASTKAGEATSAKEAAVNAQVAAENAADAAIDAKDAAIEAKNAAVDANTSATAIANEAKGIAEEAKEAADAAKEVTDGLHAIATSGSIYDIAEGANTSTGTDAVEYLIFNCGTASTVI